MVTHLDNLNGALKNINQIRNSLNEPEGELKIQLPPVLAKGLISAKLPLFSRKYPKLNLSIIFSNNEADLVKNNIDVMLLNRIPNKTDQKIRQLYSFKVRLYCTKKYADKYGIPSLPHELESHLVIGIILDDYKKIKQINIVNEKTGAEELVDSQKIINTNHALNNLEMILSNEAIAGIFSFDAQVKGDVQLVPVLPHYYFQFKYYLLKHPFNNQVNINLFCKFLEECLNESE